MKPSLSTLFLATFLTISVNAETIIDFSDYEITESQLQILRTMEASGKRDEEFLRKFAQAMETSNQRRTNQRDIYIPPYTPELLEQLSKWARGASFSSYADAAGFHFDVVAYREDCPNWAVFNFNRAHGGRHMGRSVADSALSQSHFFQAHLSRNPEGFSELYWQEAVELGFAKYLSPLENQN